MPFFLYFYKNYYKIFGNYRKTLYLCSVKNKRQIEYKSKLDMPQLQEIRGQRHGGNAPSLFKVKLL